MNGVEKKGRREKRLDRSLAKSSNWVSIYIVAVALGLTTLGLVMLFSAGAVRGLSLCLPSNSFGSACLSLSESMLPS